MADIELVIKIPEEVRVAITRVGLLRIPEKMQKEVDEAIQRGKPLRKGHGRLIDTDDLTWAKHTVDKYGYEEDTVVSWDDIADAPTIIEADTDQKKAKE